MNSPSLGVTIWRAKLVCQTGFLPRRPERSEVYAHTRPIATHSLLEPASPVLSLSTLRQESTLTPALEPS